MAMENLMEGIGISAVTVNTGREKIQAVKWFRIFHRTALGLMFLGTVSLFLWAIVGQAQEVEQMVGRVLGTYPHDPAAFTQGLLYNQGKLYESTGMYGQSQIREVEIVSGNVLRSLSLSIEHFGEGLALVDNRLIQLTWREHIAHVYDRDTFEKIGEFRYTGEGWGLCYDGTYLIMSNGSNRLFLRDPNTFEDRGSVAVTLYGQPLRNLNELEFVNGFVYANIFNQETIAQIDPKSGRVTGVINAAGLLTPEEKKSAGVLNGIAFNPIKQTFYITGKNWPKIFEVTFETAR